jgi:KUP system potassium uptake protein
MQNPDVLEVIESCRAAGLGLHLPTTTFFLGRETLVTTARTGIPAWRKRLFALMSRNALPATAFFRIPAEQVFEVGAQVEL